METNELGTKRIKMVTEHEHHSEEKQKADPDLITCAHWLIRKKRLCKMTVAKGNTYCGEHMPISNATQTEQSDRMPCPLDSKHTVYRKNLAKHLKICNAREREDIPAYIEKNVNMGSGDEDSCDVKLNDLPDEEFFETVAKVKTLYVEFIEGKIEIITAQHNSLQAELAKQEYGKETKKHLVQTSALLGILQDEQLLPPQTLTSFVEFGAGKGHLAFHLANVLQESTNAPLSHVVLIDRMSLRHKRDNKIEDRSLVQRIRADIGDLCLDRLLSPSQQVVAFSKHLCGAATDLTLRCLNRRTDTSVDFIMIAVCCHHRCDWRSFVGKKFLQEKGITPRQFHIITKMVGWAICGTGMSREKRRNLAEKKDPVVADESIENNHRPQRLSIGEREKIGFMCKRLLDYARLEYLRVRGYNAKLVYYVLPDITLENVCLLARRNTKKPLRPCSPCTT